MALRGEIIDLVRLGLLHDTDQVGRVGHVAVVQNKAHICIVRVLIKMIDTAGVEGRRTPFDAVNDVSFIEQELRKIAPS